MYHVSIIKFTGGNTMKKRLLIFLPLCVLILFGCKKCVFLWAEVFVAEKESWCEQVIKNDHRIFAAMNVGNMNGPDCQPLMLTLDMEGHAKWIKTYTHGDYSMLTCMCEVNDEVFFAGKTFVDGKYGIFIIKIDATGKKLLEKYIVAPGYELLPEGITMADNKALMLTGSMHGNTSQIKDLFILRLQHLGVNKYDVEWFKSYDMTYYTSDTSIAHAQEEGISIAHASNNLCLVAGHFYTPMYKYDPWFLAIKSDGNMLIQGRLKNEGSNTKVTSMKRISSISQTTTYAVSGITDHASSSMNMLALTVELQTQPTASVGPILRTIFKSYGNGDDYAYDIDQLTDGNLILVGECYSFASGSQDAVMIKFTHAPVALIWANAYGNALGGGNISDRFYSVEKAYNNAFVIGGATYSFPTQAQENAWVMGLDDQGRIDQSAWSDKCMFIGLDIVKVTIDWNFGCMSAMKEVVISDIYYNLVDIQSLEEDYEMESLYLCDEL